MIYDESTTYGPAHFVEWASACGVAPETWDACLEQGSALARLLNHGFIADGVAQWGKPFTLPEGVEFAVVSRTYASAEEIDNPPPGVRCYRLPAALLGEGDLGTVIATVLDADAVRTGTAEVALEYLSLFGNVPARLIGYLLPQRLAWDGYLIGAAAEGEGASFHPRLIPPAEGSES
jgi:hypothetical protein